MNIFKQSIHTEASHIESEDDDQNTKLLKSKKTSTRKEKSGTRKHQFDDRDNGTTMKFKKTSQPPPPPSYIQQLQESDDNFHVMVNNGHDTKTVSSLHLTSPTVSRNYTSVISLLEDDKAELCAENKYQHDKIKPMQHKNNSVVSPNDMTHIIKHQDKSVSMENKTLKKKDDGKPQLKNVVQLLQQLKSLSKEIEVPKRKYGIHEAPGDIQSACYVGDQYQSVADEEKIQETKKKIHELAETSKTFQSYMKKRSPFASEWNIYKTPLDSYQTRSLCYPRKYYLDVKEQQHMFTPQPDIQCTTGYFHEEQPDEDIEELSLQNQELLPENVYYEKDDIRPPMHTFESQMSSLSCVYTRLMRDNERLEEGIAIDDKNFSPPVRALESHTSSLSRVYSRQMVGDEGIPDSGDAGGYKSDIDCVSLQSINKLKNSKSLSHVVIASAFLRRAAEAERSRKESGMSMKELDEEREDESDDVLNKDAPVRRSKRRKKKRHNESLV